MKLHRLPDPKFKLLTKCDLTDGIFMINEEDEKLWYIKNNTCFEPFPLSEPLKGDLLNALCIEDKFFYLTRADETKPLTIEFPRGVVKTVGSAKTIGFKPLSGDTLALWTWTDYSSTATVFDAEVCERTASFSLERDENSPCSCLAYNYNLIGTSGNGCIHLFDIRTRSDGGRIKYCPFSRTAKHISLHRMADDNVHVVTTGMRGNMETTADIRKGICCSARPIHHTDWQYTIDVIQWGKMSAFLGFVSFSLVDGTVRLSIYDSKTRQVFETITLHEDNKSDDGLVMNYNNDYTRCAPFCLCVHHIVAENSLNM